MISLRSPKRIVARAARCSSQSSAISLVEPLMLGRELGVVPRREVVENLRPPLGEPVDLVSDVCQCAHGRENERALPGIPGTKPQS